MKGGFQIVPKYNDNIIYFHYVTAADNGCIGQIRCPNDGQMNDNLEMAQTIAGAIKKRIRKSV